MKRRRVARRGGTLGGRGASGAVTVAAAVADIGTGHPRDVPRAATPSATLLRSDGGRWRVVPPSGRPRPVALALAGGAAGGRDGGSSPRALAGV